MSGIQIEVVHRIEIGDSIKNLFVTSDDVLKEITKSRKELIALLKELKEIVMSNQQDVIQKVGELKQQVSGIGDQIVAKLTDLENQIAAGQDTSAIMSELNDLGSKLQAVDDLVPDLPSDTSTSSRTESKRGK